ncbi:MULTISPECIES: DUF6265 family protein [Sphingobium]|jgi:hypothetical protein|uniref:DUF6265 family protein n=1 Tax=Sphingobium TaxID=165695 RepID=UPI000DBB2416|nr:MULTISPECIES: DUF6265 family protein [Sphingobium]KAA9016581.1 hypothetical protein F4U94_09815 [Sphingobium limneticum]MBU0931531.1 hypothetical protein [Alphaproteobacteria bacterium]BBC99375.1 hypothetical protein YGS_C1P0631 [Sphingobium sp. YG1]
MRKHISIVAATLLLALSPPSWGGELPDWLTGEWLQNAGDRWSEEVWTLPRGGTMIGMGRVGRGESLRSWEVMRIVRAADGSLTLHAAPEGGPATVFPAVEQGVRDVTFANPGHDYPQRIRYWREGRLLMAETSKMDGSGAQNWTYSPATPNGQ